MAASGTEFSATVDAWARKSEARMLAILRESTQRVVSQAQSRVPIDTGFCRASIRASLQAMPQISATARPERGGAYTYNGGEVLGVIASAELGSTIRVGYTASYAGVLENGHSKQAPAGFVRVSAMEWGSIVSTVTAEARSRVNG
jgi:hypothetical protein